MTTSWTRGGLAPPGARVTTLVPVQHWRFCVFGKAALPFWQWLHVQTRHVVIYLDSIGPVCPPSDPQKRPARIIDHHKASFLERNSTSTQHFSHIRQNVAIVSLNRCVGARPGRAWSGSNPQAGRVTRTGPRALLQPLLPRGRDPDAAARQGRFSLDPVCWKGCTGLRGLTPGMHWAQPFNPYM